MSRSATNAKPATGRLNTGSRRGRLEQPERLEQPGLGSPELFSTQLFIFIKQFQELLPGNHPGAQAFQMCRIYLAVDELHTLGS